MPVSQLFFQTFEWNSVGWKLRSASCSWSFVWVCLLHASRALCCFHWGPIRSVSTRGEVFVGIKVSLCLSRSQTFPEPFCWSTFHGLIFKHIIKYYMYVYIYIHVTIWISLWVMEVMLSTWKLEVLVLQVIRSVFLFVFSDSTLHVSLEHLQT